MKRIISFFILLFSLFFHGNVLRAQTDQFDPLLDSTCQVISNQSQEVWQSTYMWYPGQLAAHMQKQLKKISEERCVNVGYPGKFNKDSYQTFFKRKVNVKEHTLLKWNGAGVIVCTINGERQNEDIREFSLSPGVYILQFEINTTDRLPSLIVDGKGLSDIKGWEVSLDGRSWNLPETYSMYNKPDVFPDDKQEMTVRINPYEFIPVRNSMAVAGSYKINRRGYALFDFRHLEVGTVRLNVTGEGRLSFRVGETPEEALNTDEKLYEQYPIPDVHLTGETQEFVLPERALRYLAIESEAGCQITSIVFDAILWPVTYQMEFESNDDSLNRLFRAGGASLHTSMHQFYLDGVKRDYLPWSMDAIASMFAGDYLFGDEQVSRNGLSIALMPPNPQTSDLGIVDYPLHALVGFKHFYLRYGNLETLLMYKDRIVQMLSLYMTMQDENGFISSTHSTSGFIPGWATKNGPSGKGIATYGQIMLYHNFQIGSYFADLWKDRSLARTYRQYAENLKKSILTHFWDDQRKAFINGYTDEGEKDTRISHHAQYWAVLTDLYPATDYDHLFNNIIPEIPYYKEDISYEKGYEFLAYIKAGRIKDMLQLLNMVWGDWLEQGHTRFPENFSPKASRTEQLVFYRRPYGLSLCHGANGVPPVVAILNGMLGFDQSDKKINEYYLDPDLLHLDWMKGTIPLKEGMIRYHFSKSGSNEIEIPEGCILHIGKKTDRKPLKTFKKAGVYTLD
ncbi:glycoside hydrolase [Parabacteroides sp. PF5-9]|uniref:glycoside hydrolase n=1 Tax=Parabacteroides sp. PF5-9 TaxID=1742404 RepID=UPI002475566C|nr:glycoside hydrolase [Parabacteroides sp. PF5-9]MDH6357324.1 alpha-L-rhamnosidase [Parabacteroides sp. PF5-9]